VVWNYFEAEPNEIVENIPCILGAAYACSCEYWKYLKGLSGLMYFGSDEAYISIKVWLDGGKCKLLKDIIVGHIYRNVFPYKVESVHTLYNSLLIAELLLSDQMRDIVFYQASIKMSNIFISTKSIMKEREHEIAELKQYYRSIFSVDFNFIYQWNADILRKHDNVTLQKTAVF
jgi:hypothetical protein